MQGLGRVRTFRLTRSLLSSARRPVPRRCRPRLRRSGLELPRAERRRARPARRRELCSPTSWRPAIGPNRGCALAAKMLAFRYEQKSVPSSNSPGEQGGDRRRGSPGAPSAMRSPRSRTSRASPCPSSGLDLPHREEPDRRLPPRSGPVEPRWISDRGEGETERDTADSRRRPHGVVDPTSSTRPWRS